MERKVIQVEERPPLLLNLPLSLQHLFAMLRRYGARAVFVQRQPHHLPVYERYRHFAVYLSY